MSYTRKVTTYGKKRTNVYTVRPDFTPEPKRPVKSRAIYVDSDTDDAPITPARPVRAARPVLSTLNSQQNIILVPDDLALGAKGKKASKGKSPLSAVCEPSSEEKVKPPRAARGRRIIPSTPSTSGSPAKHSHLAAPMIIAEATTDMVTPARSRHVLDCIEITSRARSTAAKTLNITDMADDLADDLESLHLSPSLTKSPPSSSSTFSPLESLLQVCTTNETLAFDAFLGSPHLLDLLPSRAHASFSKIGEASYSEVFNVKRGKHELVLKVVPLFPACQREGTDEVPDCSEPEDVLREVQITQTLAALPTSGFVEIKGTFVVQGAYPQRLIDEWESFREIYGTSSIRPYHFSDEQLFAVIVLAEGGHDLESFKFDRTKGWVQASGVFWQVVDALALAEDACDFEHRDLHEGQILISPCPITAETDLMGAASTGVKATIIDFGLSRLEDANGGIIRSDMPQEVFEGKGAQWDVYRAMRDELKSNWGMFKPVSNVMWLRYIIQYLLRSKSLLKPKMPKVESRLPGSPVRTRRIPLTKRVETKEPVNVRAVRAWEMLKRMEGALNEALDGKKVARGRAKRVQGGEEVISFKSAGAVLDYGRGQGWVM